MLLSKWKSSLLGLLFFILPFQQLASLSIAAVQFQVSPEIYQSPAHFEEALRDALDQSLGADLVVFPEYISAFSAFFFISDVTPQELLIHGEENLNYLNHLWGELAREYRCWILAGSYLEASEGHLYNTALLYNPLGELSYTQRKCFLGDPETAFGITPGNVEDVEAIEIKGRSIALTLCRDSYNEVWEEHFPLADLWIDIKGNEIPYSDEYYYEALPSRLPESPIDRGLTLSLVGTMLGYTFTGYSFIQNDTGEIYRTSRLDKQEVFLFPLEFPIE